MSGDGGGRRTARLVDEERDELDRDEPAVGAAEEPVARRARVVASVAVAQIRDVGPPGVRRGRAEHLVGREPDQLGEGSVDGEDLARLRVGDRDRERERIEEELEETLGQERAVVLLGHVPEGHDRADGLGMGARVHGGGGALEDALGAVWPRPFVQERNGRAGRERAAARAPVGGDRGAVELAQLGVEVGGRLVLAEPEQLAGGAVQLGAVLRLDPDGLADGLDHRVEPGLLARARELLLRAGADLGQLAQGLEHRLGLREPRRGLLLEPGGVKGDGRAGAEVQGDDDPGGDPGEHCREPWVLEGRAGRRGPALGRARQRPRAPDGRALEAGSLADTGAHDSRARRRPPRRSPDCRPRRAGSAPLRSAPRARGRRSAPR